MGIFPYNATDGLQYDPGNFPFNNLAHYNYNNSEYFELYQDLQYAKSTSEIAHKLDTLIKFVDEELIFIPIASNTNEIIYSNDLEIKQEDLFGLSMTQNEAHSFSTGWGNLSNSSKTSLIIGINQLYHEFHPHTSALHESVPFNFNANMQSLVFQGLYQRDYKTNYDWSPLIADEMPVISPDGYNITVNLKQDLKFGDGTPLTAYDVVGSYQIAMNEGNGELWEILNSEQDIKLLDNYTVQFNLRFPSSLYMEILKLNIIPVSFWGNYSTGYLDWFSAYDILQPDLVVNASSSLGVGTGPYIFSNLTEAWWGEISLVPNPHYAGNPPNLQEIKFVNYLGDYERALQDMSGNQLDIIYGNLIEDIGLAQTMGFGYLKSPNSRYKTMAVNHAHPVIGTGKGTPLGQLDQSKARESAKFVRKAISYALDRASLAVFLSQDSQNSVWVEGTQGTSKNHFSMYSQSTDIVEHTFDFDLAQSYMEQAGYIYEEDINTINSTTTQISSSFSINTLDKVSINIWVIGIAVLLVSKKQNQFGRRCHS